MSIIKISNLTFAYEGSFDNIFENVSFSIDTDWKLGFCGRNGRGKTTFLRLLMGKHEYSGSISASVNFEYFPYEVADHSQNTAGIISTLSPDAEPWQIQKELCKLDVGEDALRRPFSTLTGGERTKVLLAGLFLRKSSFLLIDEPTNHLDMAGRDTLARYLSDKKGFILVSHDRAFLDRCVDHVLSINRMSIDVQSGNFSSWWLNRQMQDSFETAENERLKKEISRLESVARQTAAWSDKAEKSKNLPLKSGLSADKGYIGHKAAKMMKRSKSTEKRKKDAIQEKSKLLRNIETAEPLKLHPLSYHTSRLVSIDNLSVCYGESPVFSDMSFSISQGERVALVGGNGCGKSSLLNLVCGEPLPHSGAVTVGSQIVISYVPQDASFLGGSLGEYIEQCGIDGVFFRAILRKLDFPRVQFEKDMRDYSAGQKKKVLLARSLCERAHLYIWDEPLNYIDVLSRMQIEELILAYRPTLLFVEHDRAFCENIATRTIEF